jgi:hypothetical protein
MQYPGGRYFTAMGYANLQGIHLTLNEAALIGRTATAFCKAEGIDIERVTDPRFGRINAYPESVLSTLLKERG